MWELRLILILIGVVIVTGVYLLSRQRRKSDGEQPVRLRRKSPVLQKSGDAGQELGDFPAFDTPGPRLEEEAESDRNPAKQDDQQLILALHIAARNGEEFEGRKVLDSLNGSGLKYGRYQIFHRLFENDPELSVFSVANMVEPGSFDLDNLSGQVLPGLTLFLVLPGPQDGVDAYADMLATARHLAQDLGGDVLDETRSTLTRQTAHHIRERIIEFQRRVQLHQRN